MLKRLITAFVGVALLLTIAPLSTSAAEKPVFTTFGIEQSTAETGPFYKLVGTLASGFTLFLEGTSGDYYRLNVTDATATNVALGTEYYPFTLKTDTVPSNFYSYWDAKGVNAAATAADKVEMWKIISGQNAVFYIHKNITSGDLELIDGLQHNLGTDRYWRVERDYPLGTYGYKGSVTSADGVNSDLINLQLAMVNTQIVALTVTPASFIPSSAQTTDIAFTTSVPGYVTVKVLDSSNVEKKTLLADTTSREAGVYTQTEVAALRWNGKDSANTVLAAGTYKVKVEYRATSGGSVLDTEEKTVTITDPTTLEITAKSVNFTSFDPVTAADGLIINYTMNKSGKIDAEITNADLVKVYDPSAIDATTTGSFSPWSGKYPGTNYAIPGAYSVKLEALNGTTVSDTETVTFNIQYTDSARPQIGAITLSDTSFDPDFDDVKATFPVTNTFDELTMEVRKTTGTKDLVKTITSHTTADSNHSMVWDGKDTSNNTVAVGTYQLRIIARNDKGVDSKTTTVEVDNTSGTLPNSNAHIDNIRLSPSSNFEPAEDDELSIKFDIEKDLAELKVVAVRSTTEIELDSDTSVDADNDYEVTWDGVDEDDEYVEKGTWRIEIRTEDEAGAALVGGKTININYQEPQIDDLYISKSEMDNDLDEMTYIIFKIDSDADVDIFALLDNEEDDEIEEDLEVTEDQWYAVEWDGGSYDYDDDVDIKVVAKNKANDDVYDSQTISINLDEDDVSSSKSNVTNDYIDPAIAERGESMELHYELDEQADVKITIHEGTNASGSAVIELLDVEDQEEGSHVLTWDGKDDDGDTLSNGEYSWKIVSDKDSTETEKGVFVIGDVGDSDSGSSSSDDDDDNDGNVAPNVVVDGEDLPEEEEEEPVADCAGYSDVSENSSTCAAIEWAKDENIFIGYADGTFKPFQTINRAEVLKVILEAMNINLTESGDTTAGFRDVIAGSWYMTYIATSKALGIFHGDSGLSTARPDDNVNRVEALKFAFEALKVSTGYTVTSCGSSYNDVASSSWYAPYACEAKDYDLFDISDNMLEPDAATSRAEIAEMLYRMSEAGLL